MGQNEVLLPSWTLQFPRKEELPSYERKGKFALKRRRRKLLVIETKVVIG